MWIFAQEGFLSIVKDLRSDRLLVRGRFKGDIEALFPGVVVEETEQSDYRYRTRLDRDEAQALEALEEIRADIRRGTSELQAIVDFLPTGRPRRCSSSVTTDDSARPRPARAAMTAGGSSRPAPSTTGSLM
jgi:hypothetical protein